MALILSRLTKPWRPFGNEAVYRLADGNYAITGDRMPFLQLWDSGLTELANESTIRLPGALVDEFVDAYLAERQRRHEWRLPKVIISKLRGRLAR